MLNPKEQLRSYFDTLFHRFRNTQDLYLELKRILEWNTPERPERIEAYNLGANFFELAEYSLLRIVLVETAALLSDKEQKSLKDWLAKANDHAAALQPTRYNPTTQKREAIDPNEYCELIKEHETQLDNQQTAIDHIKAWRDKAIAHFDTRFFFDPQDLATQYPLTYTDIDCLTKIINDILRKHYSYLFESDAAPVTHTLRNVDKLLKYARAFNRARNDKQLIRNGFKPIDYEQD